MRQVIVLPYYLFTGTLIQRIGRQVEHLRAQYPQVRFASGTHFGFEPEIAQLLAGRVDALMHGALAAVPVSAEAAHWEAHHHDHGHEHAHPHDHPHPHDHAHAEHGH